ncbi:uncharacterized protein [Anabrus simplex]|uniref:uncharacterized protein n=1 Tax=Anabrus simplex TaxID=316456 RepID=UPI0035A33893
MAMKKVNTYSASNTALRVTQTQKEIMVNFMERHPILVNGKVGRNLPNGAGLWKELTDILNASGGNVTKNPEKWRKTWSDMKRDVKEKAARIREQQKQSIPLAGMEERLTPLQERLLGLVSKMEDMPEEENPSEIELFSSETDVSKSDNPDDFLNSEKDASKESNTLEIDVKTWVSGDLFNNFSVKQEQQKQSEVEEGSCTDQDQVYAVQEQNGSPLPPLKKSRRLSPAETSATSTTVQAESASPEKRCARHHYSYATLAEHQAATASALSRLADVAEQRLAVEERKAAAMERFVELYFKQQKTTN